MNMNAVEVAVAMTVHLLVDQEYEVHERMTSGSRLSASEMKAAVDRYGCPLSQIPRESLLPLEVIEVERSTPQELRVDVNLWTIQEAPSDLYLYLRLTDTYHGAFDIEIEDILVP